MRPFGKGVVLGKPYRNELDLLPQTFDWACRQDLKAINRAVQASSCRSILAVGSGGSVAAAEYLAALHTKLANYFSWSQTPLESLSSEGRFHDLSLWLLSAGGRNVDILRSLRRAIQVEPAHIAVLCASLGSPLAGIARPLAIDVLEYEPPAGNDGFLATNSLATFLFLIARSYSSFVKATFVSSFAELLERAGAELKDLLSLRQRFTPLLAREHWLVVYAPGCRPVVSDMESRFSEAALGSIKGSDLRNFAHGRHHWLAKRGSSSAVIVFSQPDTVDLAKKSIALLPESIPRVHVQFSDDAILAPLGGIFLSMEIAAWVGESRGIDAGRPGVPEFGRRLYHLGAKPVGELAMTREMQIIARKTRVTPSSLRIAEIEPIWHTFLGEFRKNLYQTAIRAIVFDYDGTIVTVKDRFDPPKHHISALLAELLSAGIRIGIATGRGRSVKKDLRAVIHSKYWPLVLMGYHNGAEIGFLDNDMVPDPTSGKFDPTIESALDLLKTEHSAWERLTVDPSHSQLGLQWKTPLLGWRIENLLEPLMPALTHLGVQLVSSGHSVDLLAPGVSKKHVIAGLAEKCGVSPSEILAIGDRGRAPGNDAEMLSHCPSLSVDETSGDPFTCWRLGPPMLKGPDATIWYLERMNTRKRFRGAVFFKKGKL